MPRVSRRAFVQRMKEAMPTRLLGLALVSHRSICGWARSARVSEDCPLTERVQDASTFGDLFRHGSVYPAFQPGQGLLLPGQNAGGDEYFADIAGGGLFRKTVKQFVGDLRASRRQAGQELRARTTAKLSEHSTGGFGASETVSEEHQLGDGLSIVGVEKVLEPGAENAAAALAVGVDVAGVIAAGADEMDVRPRARTANLRSTRLTSHQHPHGSALRTGSGICSTPGVAGVADRTEGPARRAWGRSSTVRTRTWRVGLAGTALAGAVLLLFPYPPESAAGVAFLLGSAAVDADPRVAVAAPLREALVAAAYSAESYGMGVTASTDGAFALDVRLWV